MIYTSNRFSVDANIVHVQFEDRRNPGYYAGGSYSYIADHPLAVGDLVKVSTKYGESNAKVCRVNVPVTEIGCRVGELRHITEPAILGDIFTGFFD